MKPGSQTEPVPGAARRVADLRRSALESRGITGFESPHSRETGGIVDNSGEKRGAGEPASAVLLMRTWSDGEAEIVRQILAASDIPCVVGSSVTHAVLPLSVDGLGEIRILVSPDQLEQARDLLAEHLRDGLELIDGGLPDEQDPGADS